MWKSKSHKNGFERKRKRKETTIFVFTLIRNILRAQTTKKKTTNKHQDRKFILIICSLQYSDSVRMSSRTIYLSTGISSIITAWNEINGRLRIERVTKKKKRNWRNKRIIKSK